MGIPTWYTWGCDTALALRAVTKPNLHALRAIISAYFNSPATEPVLLGEGAYAWAYLVELDSGIKVVARITLPVRETWKTEAEVATMDMIRARTQIPVPKVYVFCSTPYNPVGAEWIVMQYLPGETFGACFEKLTYEKKVRVAKDLAGVIASLFSITSTHAGCVLMDHSLSDTQRARRYLPTRPPTFPAAVTSTTPSGAFTIGPYNSEAFLDICNIAPVKGCGPFSSERALLIALSYRGTPPHSLRPNEEGERSPYDRVLEIFDVLRPKYFDRAGKSDDAGGSYFHFSHGDLNETNILLDPSTGRITGVLDWEMAVFQPGWQAVENSTWFDEDSRRFCVTGRCEDAERSRDGSQEDSDDEDEFRGDRFGSIESEEDQALRCIFREELRCRNELAARHEQEGAELRAILHTCCELMRGNVMMWLLDYSRNCWDVEMRGPFPFDIDAFWITQDELYKRKVAYYKSLESVSEGSSGHT